MTAKDRKATLPEIYRRLLDAYGPQGWWPGESRFEMIAGAILTQSAAWRNVELALANLRAAGIDDWPAVHRYRRLTRWRSWCARRVTTTPRRAS